MEKIVLNAYAKINLSLTVTGRRDDGYHNIRSLMQGIDLCDVIKITKCVENGTKYNLPHCTIDGIVVYLCTDAKTIPLDMSNLALKGIAAVLGVLVTIDKKLPVAAGIAGGSGNAAACMLGVNALMGSPFSLRELMKTGARVGADVPFSLMMNARCNAGALAALEGIEEASSAAWTGGIGDIVDPAEPMLRHVILANPGIAVSTKAAYEAIDAVMAELGYNRVLDEYPLFVNDFESYTLRAYQEAQRLKSLMQKELSADIVLMSGSGPTMAAYYTDPELAGEDFARMNDIAEREAGWRVWLTVTGNK